MENSKHLVILSHGLQGNSESHSYLSNRINSISKNIIIFNPKCNDMGFFIFKNFFNKPRMV
jgi:predicted alpha/beta-fold hydrolase